MNIFSISKTKREVTLSLSSDELVKICNALYKTPEELRNNLHHKLYADMMIARELSQYGHIDDFCLDRIVEERKKIVIK